MTLTEKAHILIVDDDEINGQVLAKHLESRGFEIHFLVDATQALETIDKGDFDLILLDILMPSINGIMLLKQIRNKYSKEELPVIMSTVVEDSSDIYDAFESGANDYINKSTNIDAATARIKGQISATILSQAQVKMKEVQAVNGLVITYHHEINNPLAIAWGQLQLLEKSSPDSEKDKFKKVFTALERIKLTLEKIKEVSENNSISFESYGKISKMIKIKK